MIYMVDMVTKFCRFIISASVVGVLWSYDRDIFMWQNINLWQCSVKTRLINEKEIDVSFFYIFPIFDDLVQAFYDFKYVISIVIKGVYIIYFS